MDYRPGVIWLTGLPCAGKSTISLLTARGLRALCINCCLLDGDELRRGLNKDLGFSKGDRAESVRRASEVARLLYNNGLITICAMVSPFQAEREAAKRLFDPSDFIEVYVNTPLDICIMRDSKGMYKRARCGEFQNMTGIDHPYEPPENPDIIVSTQTERSETISSYIEQFALSRFSLR
jgi:bifunctional enzyme CysN/CysC